MINWASVFFGISAGVLTGSIILWIWKTERPSPKSGGIAPFYYFMGGCYLSAFFLFLPIYFSQYRNMPNAVIHCIASSLHHAMQLFTIDADRDIIPKCYELFDGNTGKLYALLLSAEYVIAPLLTANFIIAFFRDTTSIVRYALGQFTEMHVFSALNEKSIALASSIKKDRKSAAIIFADVFEKKEEISFELIKKAKELRAICFKKDILAIKIMRRFSKPIRFYIIGEDETENINHAIALARKYRDMDNSRLYLFTTRDEAEYLINQRGKTTQTKEKDSHGLVIRRIHEITSMIYHHLYQNGYEKLFLPALDDKNSGKSKTITVMIVGVGLHGTEMIKALSWYCQMEGYQLRIEAFDKDPLAEKRFAAACPELMNGGKQEESDDDVICKINFHSGMDVTTADFVAEIQSDALKKTTYVLVSLGSDVLNICTAVKIRTYFVQALAKEKPEGRQNTSAPVIQAIVYTAYESNELGNLVNYKNDSYAIDFIGSLASTYSKEVILNSELEESALSIHTAYYNKETFYEYEYYYRSSCAVAIHLKAVARELTQRQFKDHPLCTELLKDADRLLSVFDTLSSVIAKIEDKMACSCCQKCRFRQEPRCQLASWKDWDGKINCVMQKKLKEFTWTSWHNGELIQDKTEEIISNWGKCSEAFKNTLEMIETSDVPCLGNDERKIMFAALQQEQAGQPTIKAAIEGILREYNDDDRKKILIRYCILVEKLKEQEHRRWSAYMRSEGYIPSKKRFDLGKMHPDLKPFGKLDPSERNKDIHMDQLTALLNSVKTETMNDKKPGQRQA